MALQSVLAGSQRFYQRDWLAQSGVPFHFAGNPAVPDRVALLATFRCSGAPLHQCWTLQELLSRLDKDRRENDEMQLREDKALVFLDFGSCRLVQSVRFLLVDTVKLTAVKEALVLLRLVEI